MAGAGFAVRVRAALHSSIGRSLNLLGAQDLKAAALRRFRMPEGVGWFVRSCMRSVRVRGYLLAAARPIQILVDNESHITTETVRMGEKIPGAAWAARAMVQNFNSISQNRWS